MELANGFTMRQIASCISPKRLDLTLLSTERCNFRCSYCYETFEHGRMPPHVVEGICNLITTRAQNGLEELTLTWFGGEPLLGWKPLVAIASHAKKLSDEFGFTMHGGLTTNGYNLDAEKLATLVDLGQDFFQISLDGWAEVHDRTRRRADGAGTFDVIWANLLSARDSAHEFVIQLRVHINDSNYESLLTLCAEIRREFGEDKRFVVDFQDVRDMGGENGAMIVPVEAAEFQDIKVRLRRVLAGQEANPVRSRPTIAVAIVDAQETNAAGAEKSSEPPKKRYESAGGREGYKADENYICYAAKPNHLLIRSTGRVGKCTVALDDPRNDLGFIRPDGTIELNQDLARMWSAGIATLDQDMLGCPIAAWRQISQLNVATGVAATQQAA